MYIKKNRKANTMGDSIDKINVFMNNNKHNITKQEANKIVKNNTEIPPAKPKADLSKLPNGVSFFNIDGDEITIYKNNDKIQTQVVGAEVNDMNDIHLKIQKEIEKNDKNTLS